MVAFDENDQARINRRVFKVLSVRVSGRSPMEGKRNEHRKQTASQRTKRRYCNKLMAWGYADPDNIERVSITDQRVGMKSLKDIYLKLRAGFNATLLISFSAFWTDTIGTLI